MPNILVAHYFFELLVNFQTFWTLLVMGGGHHGWRAQWVEGKMGGGQRTFVSVQPPNSLRGQKFYNTKMLKCSAQHFSIISLFQVVSQFLNFLNFGGDEKRLVGLRRACAAGKKVAPTGDIFHGFVQRTMNQESSWSAKNGNFTRLVKLWTINWFKLILCDPLGMILLLQVFVNATSCFCCAASGTAL